VTNSWARWSPEHPTCGSLTYYWVIFSSSREGLQFDATQFKNKPTYPNEPTSQLYLTALVDDGSGTPKTFPAVYIWNQPTSNSAYPGSNQSNHTPAWEVVAIPPPPPPR
jgi:hypothetical protein